MYTNYIRQILIKELRSGSDRWIEYRPRSFFCPHFFARYTDSDDTTDPLGNGPDEVYDRIKHRYNRQGERTETKDQNETVRAFDYDKLGRQIHDRVVTVGSGVDGMVRRTSSTYDVRGSIAGVAAYDNPTVGSGSVLNELVFEYNDLGMPVREYQEHQGTKHGNTLYVQYDYDTAASGGVFTRGLRPTSVRYPNGRRIHLDYGASSGMADALARVAAIRDDDGGSPGDTLAEYAYLGLGRIVTEDYVQPQVKLNYDTGTPGDYAGFDRFDRVIDHRWYAYGASADRDRYTYGYDRASNRLYRENTLTTGRDELYSYDQVNRLIAFQRGELNATKDGITGTPVKAEEWGLDTTGNWDAFLQETSGTTDLDQGRTHNPVNEITAITATTGTNWADPEHDRAGNMTTIPKPANLADGLTATYDAWNRLVEVKDGQTVIARYEYDGLNRRIKSHIDSGAPSNPTGIDSYLHCYYTSSWQILETRQSDTPSAQPETLQPKHQYVWSQRYIDAPVLRDENTGTNVLCDDERLYYLNDANFNVTALLDTAGDAVERYVYSPYGVVTIYDATWTNTRSTSSYANVTLYTGRELDPETGLYHYRNRYYGAELGRFVSRDPVGFRGNRWGLYEYVDGHPLNLLDPFGQEPQTDIKPTGGPPSDGGQKGWPFPKCDKNCHGFCFQLKNYGELTNCTITKMQASEGCSRRISAAIATFRRADKVPFVKGPCQTLEAWLTDSPHIMTKPFSSCRGKRGGTCDCTNRRPFQGSPFTLTINHTIPLEQFIPSPIPTYFIENVPVDLTDPKILTEIRQCDVIVDASITLSNANGWIGQCTQRKN